jgi:hypothetical protein
MSNLLVQFNNPNNWIEFYADRFTAQPVDGGKRYLPIPSQTLSIVSDSPIIAAKTQSDSALLNWQTGGWLTPLYDLSSTSLLEVRANRYSIPLKFTRLIVVPDFALTFQLRFDAPKWLRDVRLDIWQYIGPIDDSTEKLVRQLGNGLNINL